MTEPSSSQGLADQLDAALEGTSFSGVVRLSLGGEVLFERARGLADRAHEIRNTLETQFAIASGAKGFTALGMMSLVEAGAVSLDTPVRSILDDALELIHPAVTVEHLLAHTSGIGDYLDEGTGGAIDEYVMPIPVHRLSKVSDYLTVLEGHPMKFPPGTRFEYCNGGYVVLALLIEEVSGMDYYELLQERVFDRADMTATSFLRLDELPGSAALGYLGPEGLRTNQLHLPVRGCGDGGAYSTLDDLDRFWAALAGGRILASPIVEQMLEARNDAPGEGSRYGLGFWLRADRETVMLEGYDAGVSFRSAYDVPSGLVYTVISNSSDGAWPIVKIVDVVVPDLAGGA